MKSEQMNKTKQDVHRITCKHKENRQRHFVHHSHLLVAVLHRVLQFSFGGRVFFEVDLLQMLYGCSMEVIQLCTERCCSTQRAVKS